jgi:hypothetical protein
MIRLLLGFLASIVALGAVLYAILPSEAAFVVSAPGKNLSDISFTWVKDALLSVIILIVVGLLSAVGDPPPDDKPKWEPWP